MMKHGRGLAVTGGLCLALVARMQQGPAFAQRTAADAARVAPPFRALMSQVEGKAPTLEIGTEEAALRSEIEAEAVRWAAAQERADRQDFLEFWRAYGRGFRHTPETRTVWAGLRERLAARGVELPPYPELDAEATAMVTALYSAREGVPVIWKFGKLVQVAHQLAENHPRQLSAFGHALKAR